MDYLTAEGKALGAVVLRAAMTAKGAGFGPASALVMTFRRSLCPVMTSCGRIEPSLITPQRRLSKFGPKRPPRANAGRPDHA
jgi:hypothetical protein